MPAGSNIHEVAQSAAPESRVVYVDHDPIVLSHARELLISGPEGRTDFIEADLRQPLATLTEAARTLDSGRPVAVILTAILHLIQDAEGPHQLVRQLVGALAPGSAVMIRRRHQAVAPALGVPLGRRYRGSAVSSTSAAPAVPPRVATHSAGRSPAAAPSSPPSSAPIGRVP